MDDCLGLEQYLVGSVDLALELIRTQSCKYYLDDVLVVNVVQTETHK